MSTHTDAGPVESPLATPVAIRVLAVVVFGATLVQVLSEPLAAWSDPAGWPRDEVLSRPAFVTFLAAGLATQALALTLTRRAPAVAVVLTFGVQVMVAMGLDSPRWLEPANLAVAVSVFFMAQRGPRLRTTVVLTAMVAASCALQWRWVTHSSGAPASQWGPYLMHSTLKFMPLVIAAALLGGLWGNRSRKLAAERGEAEAARREHQERVSRAEQAERERIAQELHDVAAQHLSGLLSLANAAVDLADDDPRTAVGLIADVRNEGRFAVASIYGALGELRTRGVDPPVSTPDAHQLDALATQWRARGMSVELLALGDLAALPAVVSVTVYRTVQEALANAAKHAPGAPVRVRVLVDVGRLSITVENGEPSRSATATSDGIGLGWGLSGLRQRLTLLGGALLTSPTPDGGWRVSAELPLNPSTTTTCPAQ